MTEFEQELTLFPQRRSKKRICLDSGRGEHSWLLLIPISMALVIFNAYQGEGGAIVEIEETRGVGHCELRQDRLVVAYGRKLESFHNDGRLLCRRLHPTILQEE